MSEAAVQEAASSDRVSSRRSDRTRSVVSSTAEKTPHTDPDVSVIGL